MKVTTTDVPLIANAEVSQIMSRTTLEFEQPNTETRAWSEADLEDPPAQLETESDNEAEEGFGQGTPLQPPSFPEKGIHPFQWNSKKQLKLTIGNFNKLLDELRPEERAALERKLNMLTDAWDAGKLPLSLQMSIFEISCTLWCCNFIKAGEMQQSIIDEWGPLCDPWIDLISFFVQKQ